MEIRTACLERARAPPPNVALAHAGAHRERAITKRRLSIDPRVREGDVGACFE